MEVHDFLDRIDRFILFEISNILRENSQGTSYLRETTMQVPPFSHLFSKHTSTSSDVKRKK